MKMDENKDTSHCFEIKTTKNVRGLSVAGTARVALAARNCSRKFARVMQTFKMRLFCIFLRFKQFFNFLTSVFVSVNVRMLNVRK